MKKAKKILSFLLAVSMVAGMMSACNNTPAENTSSGGGTSSAGTESIEGTEPEEKDYSEKLTYTIGMIDAEKLGVNDDGTEAADWVWLKEKFNFDFEPWALTWSNYVDQTRMWLNSDDAPDLMLLDVAAVRYGEFLDWVDAGLLHPYPDLADYPNLQSRFENMSTGKKFMIDGTLYAWPAYLDTAEFMYTRIGGYKYRVDWAKETGMYNEDDIYTWDEWWEMCDKVLEMQLGGADTIPLLSGNAWSFPNYITVGISPYMFSFTQNDSGEWVWGASLDETTEALEFIKEKYDAGIIWKDQPILPQDAEGTNFNAGKLFASVNTGTSTQAWMNSKKGFEDANPGLVYEDTFSIAKVKSPNGKFTVYSGSDQWSQEAMNHNLSDEKVDRYMDLLEYLASDEGYYVRNAGIPDVDWKWEGDEAVILWEENEAGELKRPYQGNTPWARIAGCNDNFSNYSPQYPEKVQEMILSGYETYSSDEAEIIVVDPDVAYFTDEAYLDATAGLEEQTYQKIAELIIHDDFIDQWHAWVEQKSAELAPAIEALNAAFPA